MNQSPKLRTDERVFLDKFFCRSPLSTCPSVRINQFSLLRVETSNVSLVVLVEKLAHQFSNIKPTRAEMQNGAVQTSKTFLAKRISSRKTCSSVRGVRGRTGDENPLEKSC